MGVLKLFELASRMDKVGVTLTRVGLIVVLLWIGGLKAFHYEADGIVPFVANSPTMSFFYADPGNYKAHKNPEGALVPENRSWHEANWTYLFAYGLGFPSGELHLAGHGKLDLGLLRNTSGRAQSWQVGAIAILAKSGFGGAHFGNGGAVG